MAKRTLEQNIRQAISDFDGIKTAIEDKGVTVPFGTDTSEYGDKVGDVYLQGYLQAQKDFCGPNRGSFKYAFERCEWEKVDSIDTSSGTDFQQAFIRSSVKEAVLDLSNATNLYQAFCRHSQLEKITILNMSKNQKAVECSLMCWVEGGVNGDPKLREITGVNLTYASNINQIFAYCSKLEVLEIVGTIKLNGFKVSDSPLLTHDSLMTIINALEDKTSDTTSTTWTCTLGATNLAKLSDAEKAIATGKGWTLA